MGEYQYKNEVGTHLSLTPPPEFPPPLYVSVPTGSIDQEVDTFYLLPDQGEKNQPWPRQWPKRKFVVITSNWGEHKVAANKVLFQDGWIIFADGGQNEPRRNIKAYPAHSVKWIEEQTDDE